MSRLIEALTIFLKYKDAEYPAHCEHDVLYVVGITQDEISPEDQKRLEELGFLWLDHEGWGSFHYGSA